MQYEADKGYLVLACNNNGFDYIQCAETLALSLRYWHPDANICLVTDNSDYQNKIFNSVKCLPYGNLGGWANDWQAYFCSPYHETVKLEADMFVSSPIDHWWSLYRHKSLWISTGCKDFHGNISKSRRYRKIFDLNQLPDVYNALTYWRVSEQAEKFFRTVQQCFENWDVCKSSIVGGQDEVANTDLIYAITAELYGRDNFTIPNIGPQIVHMKPSILKTSNEDWSRELVWEIVNGGLRINGHAQRGFVHYHQKHLAKDFIKYYE